MALINCPECGVEVSDKAEKCPKCAYPINATQTISNTNEKFSNQQLAFALVNGKSKGLGLFLTLFFGPIGMLYATVKGAITMIITGIISTILIFSYLGISMVTADTAMFLFSFPLIIVGSIVYWIMCIVMTFNAIDKHNASILSGVDNQQIEQETNPLNNIKLQEQDITPEVELLKLKELINKEKSNGIFDKSNKPDIVNHIRELCSSKSEGLNLIKSYELKFKANLIEDLMSLSSNYDSKKYLLIVFIELGIVDKTYPHTFI